MSVIAPAHAIAYVNGEFLPQKDATISIMDRGFLFADGIYEVSAVINGRLVDNALHIARLVRSVGEIDLALPEPPEKIASLMREIVTRNALQEGLVYLQVTRGAETSRPVDPTDGVRRSEKTAMYRRGRRPRPENVWLPFVSAQEHPYPGGAGHM